MTSINDIVLIYFEDKPLVFARVEGIFPDVKAGWYGIKLLFLQVPLQVVTWTLRDVYINGGEFTMNAKRVRLEKVVAARACIRLADAGIPLGCQTVLLKGVNDNAAVMRELMQKLLRFRVKPYYLHQADLVKGTAHFRTSIQTGVDILKNLQTDAPGLCVPSYMIDLPSGCGKIPLQPAG